MTTTSWAVTAAQTFYLDIFSRRLKMYINSLEKIKISACIHMSYVAFQIQTKQGHMPIIISFNENFGIS